MNDYLLKDRMPNYAITRQEVLNLVREVEPSFREGQMKLFLKHMMEDSVLERVGRNLYRKKTGEDNLSEYRNQYSKEALKVISIMNEEYPMVDYRIWELNWLNEFFNHQIGRNYIFLEVEKDGCEFIFDRLAETYESRTLLRPDEDTILRYGIDDSCIIDRLISESPKGNPEKYNLALEKLIVDLFANKNLRSMLSLGDYQEAITTMFRMYKIDLAKMYRYARRRNKEEELKSFMKQKTSIILEAD